MKKVYIPGLMAVACMLTLLCTSCKESGENKAIEPKPARTMRLCTELYSTTQMGDSLYGYDKSAAAAQFIWPTRNGRQLTLKVKFLNGTGFQRNKVIQYAQEWEDASVRMADGSPKVKFSFLPPNFNGKTDIRILFEPGGSQSAIGKNADAFGPNEPTMKFGWINEHEDKDTNEASIRQVVLHEFGHALGLIHEHQHPDAAIKWDSTAVYAYYRDTQSPPWSETDVNNNIFMRYNKASLNSLAYDPKSIMHYAIPDSLTINKCCGTEWNLELSAEDKRMMKKMYPLDNRTTFNPLRTR